MYGAGDVRVEQVADAGLSEPTDALVTSVRRACTPRAATAACGATRTMVHRPQPGRVFDSTIGIDEVPEGYRAMNDRETIKAMVKP